MRRLGGWRFSVAVVLTAGIVAGAAPGALATDAPFDPGALASLLPGGASLGTVAGIPLTTHGYTGSGPCPSASMPSGYPNAVAVRTTAAQRSLLRLGVADDLAGSASLCRVSLYAGEIGDPFDAAGRNAALLAETAACESASSCAIEAWLDAGETYVVVFWGAPPPDGAPEADAALSYDASVKASSPLGIAIAGHRIREVCSGYHEVVTGRPYTVTATPQSSPPGTIRFAMERPTSAGWVLAAVYDRPLEGGRAVLTLTAGTPGRWRVRATSPEDAASLEVLSDYVLISFVSPRMYRYGDGGVRLTVPWHRQQYRLTCEAATLRMAHNYHHPGRIRGDLQALRVIGVDSRRPRGNRWGNPDRAFVGAYDGRMMHTGYGVHAGPVARAATRYDRCRPGLALTRPSRATIAGYVYDGFPVIVWGAHAGRSGIYRKRWRAWDGQLVTAWSVEHVWVVVGFRGPRTNPTAFIVHDPSRGAKRTVSIAAFNAFTKYYRTAVVVRG